MGGVNVIESMFGHVRGVHRVTKGHSFAAAAPVGATVLTLNEVSDFDEEGGQVLVSGLVYDYTAVDEAANTITLATALTVAAAVDDPADVFDPVVGSIAVVGYEAEVMLDDADPTGRSITVSVQHGLVPMLEESVRGESAEAVTLVRDGEHDWMIWQVDGKLAVDLLADAAAEAAATAADLALEALTAAELAEAIIDGYIEYYYQTSMPWPTGDLGHEDDFGDVWVDTDSSPQAAYRWRNDRTWTLITDNSLVEALFAAQAAQVTADGKITHYVGTWALPAGPPPEDGISHSYGDIYTKQNEDNREYYWDGNSWEANIKGTAAIADEILGKIFTGGMFRTSTAANRMQMRDDGAGGVIEAYLDSNTTSPGVINPVLNQESFPAIRLRSPTSGTRPASAHIDIISKSSSDLAAVYVNAGTFETTGQATIGGNLGMPNGATLTAGKLNSSNPNTTTDVANVRMSDTGFINKVTSSARRYKKHIRDAALDLSPWRRVRVRSYRYRAWYHRGDALQIGLIADELHELGLTDWVIYGADGEVEDVAYARLTVPLLALYQEQQDQIDDLEARLSRLESKVT